MTLSESTFETIRKSEFSALSSIYFNAAYMGPMPARTRLSVIDSTERWGDPSYMDYGWVGIPDRVREKIASLLGCSAERIALNSSTSEVISFAAFGLGLQAGDHVALVEGEYPSDVLSWMLAAERSGAVVDFFPAAKLADPRGWVQEFHPKTKVCNVSHVSFQTGSMVDLKALGAALADRDILFVADVTQSFGGMPLDPQALAYIDVMPCSTYKWMLAPYGQAFSYWSEKACQRIQHMHAGWLTMPQAPQNLTAYTKAVRPGARKFDRGQTPNVLGALGLETSLGLLAEVGLSRIYEHNQTLVRHFHENYSRQKYQLLTVGEGSNILCLKAQNIDSGDLQARMRQAGIDVSVREGNLRISFHLFNGIREVEALLKV